jgi:hypothetical protein
MPDRRPSNSELRLQRLAEEEPASGPRGILEIFSEGDESDDADAALTRETDDE